MRYTIFKTYSNSIGTNADKQTLQLGSQGALDSCVACPVISNLAANFAPHLNNTSGTNKRSINEEMPKLKVEKVIKGKILTYFDLILLNEALSV